MTKEDVINIVNNKDLIYIRDNGMNEDKEND